MSKELTAIYFRWLNQVGEDPELPAAAFKLAFVYQQHVSSDHMKAFAGQKRLAECVGVSERSIRTLTKLLKDHGHLDVETNHGPNQTNVCRLILNRKSASSFSEDVWRTYLRPIGPNEEAGFLINEEVERTRIGKIEHEKRKPASDKLLRNHSSNQRPALPPCSIPCLIPVAREPSIAKALGSLGPRLEARIGAPGMRVDRGSARPSSPTSRAIR